MSQDAHTPTPTGPPNPPSGDARELLDAYLDGMLSGDQLARFERALAADSALRAEVDSQRSINNALVKMFDAPAGFKLRNRTPGAGTVTIEAPKPAPALKLGGTPADAPPARTVTVPRGIRPFWAAAAAIVLVGGAAMYYTGVIDPAAWLTGGQKFVAAADVYERKVRTGFNPDWVCETDEQFLQNTTDMFGKALLVRSTQDVKVVGWSYYEPVLSEITAILLTTVDDQKVIVVMDKLANDHTLKPPPASSGLKQFRQEFGGVVMYELTPFDKPRVLPLVEQK